MIGKNWFLMSNGIFLGLLIWRSSLDIKDINLL